MSNTAHRVIWQVDRACGARKTVSPFERELDAKAWIADEKWRATMDASKERP